jgi:hypothetical protein
VSGSGEQGGGNGGNDTHGLVVDDDIHVDKGTNVEIPPLSALKLAIIGRLQDSLELNDVGIDTQLGTSSEAENLSFGSALHTETKVGLESSTARLDGDRKRLATNAITVTIYMYQPSGSCMPESRSHLQEMIDDCSVENTGL